MVTYEDTAVPPPGGGEVTLEGLAALDFLMHVTRKLQQVYKHLGVL